MHLLADRLDDALRGPLDSNKLRDINMCWARGVYWCDKFSKDENPLRMP